MNVLIVDDSIYMRSLIKTILRKDGFDIAGEAKNGEEAIDLAIELKPDLITMDNILPDMHGIDILLTIRDAGVMSKIVMVSAVGHHEIKQLAAYRGALEYVVKPFDADQLLSAVDTAIQGVTRPVA